MSHLITPLPGEQGAAHPALPRGGRDPPVRYAGPVPSPLVAPRPQTSGPRILLVDDDPGVLKGLRGLLSDEGFSPVEARSTAEALRLLDAPGPPPALMLLDLRMPGETGLELLARWWCSPARPPPPRPCRP